MVGSPAMRIGRRNWVKFGLLATIGCALLGSVPAARAEGGDARGEQIAHEADRSNDGFVGERSAFTLTLLNAGDRASKAFA